MKRSTFLLLILAAALPFAASAHKAFLVPSETVVAGDNAWITVDAGVSNDLFYFNHAPLRLDGLVILAPDGSRVQPQNSASGKYRNVFDVELKTSGTYRIGIASDSAMASWEINGERKRWRGAASELAANVPMDAKNLEVNQTANRIETFVTYGSPTETVLKPTGSGLEMVPVTHPNDLFAGEDMTVRFQVDGKPAPNLDVLVVRGDTRYRNAQDEMKFTTDAKGQVTVKWPEAGMYWLQASGEDTKVTVPQAKKRRLNYIATLEVLPQ